MRPTLRSSAWLAAAVIALLPSVGRAQGSLAMQGIGYPPGQFSTRTGTAGGSTAEVDPLTPINPAALANLGITTLYFQAEPEYRRVTVAGQSSNTAQSRFPILSGGFAMGSRWSAGLSFSTLSDRTWQTSIETLETIGGDTARATSSYRSQGAINDTRLAVAYVPRSWIRVGLGLHALSGRNHILVERVFADRSFATFTDTNTISYGGNAVSLGLDARLSTLASVALSYRKGGRMSAESTVGDSVIGRGDVPDRLGFSVAYLGIARSVLAVRAAQEKWSQIEGIGSSALRARDTWEYSVGGDIAGPRFGPRVLMLRVGARWRELPFAVVGPDGLPGPTVEETALSGGVGTLLANGRAMLDLGLIRASRSADVDASERSWFLSIGLTIRP